MSVRDTINSMPAWQKYGAVLIALAVPLAAIVWQLWPAPAEARVPETRGQTVFKCTECGMVLEPTAKELRADPSVAIGPRGGVMMCPKCQKRTMRTAERCPECSTVFFAEYTKLEVDASNSCPKCGWSRVDEVLESIRTQP